ncbi:hypothetical protein V8C86DRAFT_2873579 [Haematococcus lacustris]
MQGVHIVLAVVYCALCSSTGTYLVLLAYYTQGSQCKPCSLRSGLMSCGQGRGQGQPPCPCPPSLAALSLTALPTALRGAYRCHGCCPNIEG